MDRQAGLVLESVPGCCLAVSPRALCASMCVPGGKEGDANVSADSAPRHDGAQVWARSRELAGVCPGRMVVVVAPRGRSETLDKRPMARCLRLAPRSLRSSAVADRS